MLVVGCVEGQQQIRVDVSHPGTPISKYIYGQFIEHLGRSIYGGLWAEMLEDRKFFFIIRDRYAPWGVADDPYWGSGPCEYLRSSPWKVIGPAGTVTMDTDDPFAGIHTPSVNVQDDSTSVGISQEGLALVAGKSYTGRVVLSGDSGVTVRVRLVGDDGNALEVPVGVLGAAYRTYPLRFDAHSFERQRPDRDHGDRKGNIDRVAAAHRMYRASIPELGGRDIRIAMDEWSYWDGPYIHGELGVQCHLKDALGVARALHAFSSLGFPSPAVPMIFIIRSFASSFSPRFTV
jgi:hypothetical protein